MKEKSLVQQFQFYRGKLLSSDFFLKISQAFVLQVVALGVGFLSNIILARSLGTGQYGMFSLALSWMLMLSLLSRLGLSTGVLKFIPIYTSEEKWSKIKGLVIGSQLVIFGAGIMIYLIAYLVINYGLDISTENKNFFSLFMLVLPIYSLLVINGSIFRAYKKVGFALTGLMFSSFVFALVIGFNHYYLGLQVSTIFISKCYFIVTLAILLIYSGFLFFVKNIPLQIKKNKAETDLKTWMAVSIPLLFIESLQFLLAQTDILMLGALSTPEEVGIYQAAVKVSTFVAFGLGAVNFMLAPEISKLFHENKLKELQDRVSQTAKLLFVYGCIASIGLFMIGGFILNLFGEQFVTGYLAMVILIFGQFINVFTGAVGFLMSMTGHHNAALQVIIVSVIINISLNYYLIPLYGIEGAATATAISTIIRNLWMAIIVRKTINIKPTILF